MTLSIRLIGLVLFIMLLLVANPGSVARAEVKQVKLTLGGTPQSFAYISNLLTRVLEREGYSVDIEYVGDIPMTRLERMLAQGVISALILGETDSRNQRLTPIRIGMTNGLVVGTHIGVCISRRLYTDHRKRSLSGGLSTSSKFAPPTGHLARITVSDRRPRECYR